MVKYLIVISDQDFFWSLFFIAQSVLINHSRLEHVLLITRLFKQFRKMTLNHHFFGKKTNLKKNNAPKIGLLSFLVGAITFTTTTKKITQMKRLRSDEKLFWSVMTLAQLTFVCDTFDLSYCYTCSIDFFLWHFWSVVLWHFLDRIFSVTLS